MAAATGDGGVPVVRRIREAAVLLRSLQHFFWGNKGSFEGEAEGTRAALPWLRFLSESPGDAYAGSDRPFTDHRPPAGLFFIFFLGVLGSDERSNFQLPKAFLA